MTQRDERKWHKSDDPGIRRNDLSKVLDILLALDRMVVEHSMHIYNIPRRDRFIMREQNQRLHDAVREYLPRLVEPPRDPL